MSIVKIYNTADKSQEQIDSQFVVRKNILEQILEDLISSKMKYPEQDFLIVGERGMGKTMLLTKLMYEIKSNQKIKSNLIPILFPEELNGVNDLYDLWSSTIDHLIDSNPQYSYLSTVVNDINVFDKDAESDIFSTLITSLKTNRDNLVLLIDNMDSLLEKIGEEESKRLREILITTSRIRIIGASSKAIEATFRYDKAFYEHFAIIRLKGLNYKETVKLLIKLGEIFGNEERINKIIEEEKYRIEALRTLTGGNLRNIVMLFNILLSDSKKDPLDDLIKILEEVTPLNIHKITALKKQQRKIVDFVALHWDAVLVKEISKGVRMKSNEVSAQLKSLEANGIIISKETNTRKKLYQLKDRFFNIWYLMRYSRKGERNRVKWLINFYKIWCSNDDLKIKGEKLLHKITNKNCSPYNIYIEAIAILLLENVSIGQKEKIYKTTVDYLSESNSKYLKELQKIYELVTQKGSTNSTLEIEEIISEIDNEIEDKNLSKGLYFEKVKKEFTTAEGFYKKAIKSNKGEAYHRLGHLFYNYNKKGWRKHFQKAIDAGSEQALSCYTNILLDEEEYFKAEELLKYRWDKSRNIDIGLYLGNLYEEKIEDADKAMTIYKEIFEHTNSSYAVHRIAHLYEEKEENKKAEEYFKKAILLGETSCKNCLAWNYYKADKNKRKALQLIEEVYNGEQLSTYAHTYASILLWHNKIKASLEIAEVFMKEEGFAEEYQFEVFDFLMLLMKNKQFNVVDEYFQNKELNLKEIFKPLYFALMHFLKSKYPNELNRMGSEISDTVFDIVNEINSYKKIK